MEFTAEATDSAKKIKLVIFDVDGVLTDGGIYIGVDGELYKSFYCRDGLAISLARRCDLKTAIITGRSSKQVTRRAEDLSIDAVWQGCDDKRGAYRELKQKFDLRDEDICYVGDDLIDLPVMVQVGLAAAVGDAAPEVRARAHIVTDFPGGRGAVRQVIEFILTAQGHWAAIVEDYSGRRD